jgi:pyruvate/2-oxoglutarate dehydrogenase complex dihydrolipoamide dehydrogenase (E3) component
VALPAPAQPVAAATVTAVPVPTPRVAAHPIGGLTAEVVVLGAGAAGIAAAEGITAGTVTAEPSGRAFAEHPGLRLVIVDDAPAGRAGWGPRLVLATLHEAASRHLTWGEAAELARRTRHDVVTQHEARLRALQQRLGPQVLVLPGRARLAGRGTVIVEPQGAGGGAGSHRIAARRVVLATGCVPAMPEVTGLLDTQFVTAAQVDGLLDAERPPASIAVLGAGSTGCAVAQALARLGVSVTLVDGNSRVLPGEDPDAAAAVTAALRRDGVRLLLGSPVVKVAPTLDGGAWLGTAAGVDVAAERLVLATGWRAASAGLELPAVGVRLGPAGTVTVDSALVSSAPEILAAGGVVAGEPHATAALAMGAVAGANAVARRPSAAWSAAAVATLTLTDPEVASVGLTGPDAIRARREAGSPTSVGTVPWSQVPRAVLGGSGEGFVRVVVGGAAGAGGRWMSRRTAPVPARVLGATVVGPRAGDLVTPLALAIGSGLPASALATTVSADPTWSSALQLAVTRACAAPDGG